MFDLSYPLQDWLRKGGCNITSLKISHDTICNLSRLSITHRVMLKLIYTGHEEKSVEVFLDIRGTTVRLMSSTVLGENR